MDSAKPFYIAPDNGAITFDSARGRLVLFGIDEGHAPNNDTWELPSFATPVASPGASRTVNVGSLVGLDASASGVDDQLNPTYSWARSTSSPGTGPPVSLRGAATSVGPVAVGGASRAHPRQE